LELLKIVDVSKSYASHQALKKVSLTIPEQSIYGLLGPNGAGKTSLIRIITQITQADQGNVYFKGEELQGKHVQSIGYLPEERGLYKKMKVGEQLLYLAQLKGLSKKVALERAKNWFIKFEIQGWWNKTIQELSKGMQQKVQFIASILHEPELIILDEPFTGFDPINADLIKNEILELKAKGKTILFSSHRMESIEELCDHIALIHQSEKRLEGSTKDIKKQFKTHQYIIQYKGLLQNQEHFTILEQKTLSSIENVFEMTISIDHELNLQGMLQKLILEVELIKFEEKIPTMNDIFIKVVQNT
jgi:ABC-2 type transport system ATP-binding protein